MMIRTGLGLLVWRLVLLDLIRFELSRTFMERRFPLTVLADIGERGRHEDGNPVSLSLVQKPIFLAEENRT
jgi:hypothetical protein